jgi:hypothetical protein
MAGLLRNKITGIQRIDDNLHNCTLQLTINNDILVIFKYYYGNDSANIIYNELIQEKIFLDPDELRFFIRPFSNSTSRFISIKNRY